MRIGFIVCVALTTLVVDSEGKPANQYEPSKFDLDHFTTSQNRAQGGRNLKSIDEEVLNNEDRTNLDAKTEKWLLSLLSKSDDELSALARAPKGIDVEKVLERLKAESTDGFKKLVLDGVTPNSMRVDKGIDKKMEEMTKSQLLRDADVQTYLRFKDFWDALPKHLRRQAKAS